ncbi:hypothetical protein Lal_00044156 [Lupinus albus]|nr:hypothetical protein Lal_00044156 [Lupinus albus]
MHPSQRLECTWLIPFKFKTFPSPINSNHATFPFITSSIPKTLSFPKYPLSIFKPKKTHLPLKVKRTSFVIRASNDDNSQTASNWSKWIPTGYFAADQVFRLIAGATASPIGQFVSSPTTFLHSIDPRVKLSDVTGMAFSSGCSTGTVTYNNAIWISNILDFAFNFDSTKRSLEGLGADGVPSLVQLRTPPPALTGLPNLPVSLSGYSYVIAKLGPLTFTRKGLSVASTAACLTFTVFQSASLCLTTTTPEQLASALRWFLLPMRYIGVSVSEVVLTLLLSLRFISLVFDEVRNIALGIVSRRVNWKHMTFMETIDVFFNYFRRIFKNIFSHAEQISQAMIVRGFKGDSDTHKIYFLSESSFGMADFISLFFLVVVTGAAFLDGHDNNNNNSLKNEPPHGDSLHAPPPFIPFEVITEILSRVPVKSLIQFKCVCKSWKTLISDSEFARKHLSTIHHHHNLLLTINDNFDNLLIGSYSLQSVFETAISNQVSYPLNTENCFDLVVGSCDGMLCFSVKKSCALLWNPTIRVFKKLPPLEKHTIYGFGFDQCSDSYKVVAILRRQHYSDDTSSYITEIKVHNLGTDSWRRIQEYPSGNPTDLSAKFVSGTLNWLAFLSPSSTSYSIISLDLGLESCQELVQPDYGEVSVLSLNLGVLKNCLSITAHIEEGFSDVWLMNEHGNKESWTKFLSIPCLGGDHFFPYGKVICIYEDEVLFEFHTELAIYNSTNGTYRFPEITDICGWLVPQIYIESLISPCS